MWLPLMDYAMQSGLSLSTLRRYIKHNKIQHKMDKGRYMIWSEGGIPKAASSFQTEDMQYKVNKLERDLQKAQVEISELKTLIALYEEKLPN